MNNKYIIEENQDELTNIDKLLTGIFVNAVNDGASDIHIFPEKKYISIKFRIEGKFKTYKLIPYNYKDQIISKIKILANLKFEENRLPQDGSFTIYIEGGETYLRISTLPSLYGEKIVIRVLNSKGNDITLENLGFLDIYKEKVIKYLKEKNGLILVVGATGSGKSTTLLTALKQFNPEEYNITTLEDPIEYRIEGVTHSQINHEIGYTFGSGLRSILRQDPDIIMVGEIRDPETAKLGLEAAITGHLVFSTIHANSSINSLERLVSLGIDKHLVASGIKLIIYQTLVKKLCPKCKIGHDLEENIKSKINEEINRFGKSVGEKVFVKNENGCEYCNFSGYKGRLGLYEVLENTKGIKKIITSGFSESEIEDLSIKEGLISIKQDGYIKVSEGLISINDLNKVLGIN